MSGTITVSSTTDSQQQVDAAADYGQQTLPLTEEEKPGPSEVVETETAADQEPAEEPGNGEEEEEPEEPKEEEEPPEAAAEAKPAMGRTRRQREAALARLLARDEAREKRMAEMEERLRKYEQPVPQPAAAKDYSKRPDENDPKYVGKYGDFVEDMSRYVRQLEEREKAEQQQKQLREQQAELGRKVMREYSEQVDEAKVRYRDFVDVVRSVEEALPEWLQLQTMDLPNGAEVAYYLGKHPEALEQLVELNRAEVRGGALEMSGMVRDISRQLNGGGSNSSSASSSSASSPRSHEPRPAAPRPLRHVGGASAATAPAIDPDKMSQKDYNAWRDAGGGR